MTEIPLRELDKSALDRAIAQCKQWSAAHQAEVGIAEMALGAAILSWAVMNTHIAMGHDIAASKLADLGGMAGAGMGATASTIAAATILKGIFVGGIGGVAGVTCIPAVALIGGATMILGAFGYVAGDKLGHIFHPPAGFGDLLQDASMLAVGTALMIDGARRIINDERVLVTASKFKDGVIRLACQASEIIAASWEELQELVKEMAQSPSAYATVATSTATGAVIGSSIAAGSVTVLGSHSLGAVALSMGLVSAPVWPLIAGGAAGLALGVAAWRGIKHYQKRENAPSGLTLDLDKK